MKFRTRLHLAGKTATGVEVPESVVTALGAGKRPPVKVTINGHSYRSTIVVYSGRFMMPVAAEHREGAGIEAGQEIEVEVELDTAPREVEVPADLAEALAQDAALKAAFDRLSYTVRKEHARQLESAKAPETRARRLAKVLESLKP